MNGENRGKKLCRIKYDRVNKYVELKKKWRSCLGKLAARRVKLGKTVYYGLGVRRKIVTCFLQYVLEAKKKYCSSCLKILMTHGTGPGVNHIRERRDISKKLGKEN